ncbi:unnamed protein product, partial [Musa acuminata var. zebrina]
MVDFLGRAGSENCLISVLEVPFEPNGAMWAALLAAARRAHENLDDSAKLRK